MKDPVDQDVWEALKRGARGGDLTPSKIAEYVVCFAVAGVLVFVVPREWYGNDRSVGTFAGAAICLFAVWLLKKIGVVPAEPPEPPPVLEPEPAEPVSSEELPDLASDLVDRKR